MSKPINFKPSQVDQALINAISEKAEYKTTAELIRAALLALSHVTLSEDERKNAILMGYEKEVSGDK